MQEMSGHHNLCLFWEVENLMRTSKMVQSFDSRHELQKENLNLIFSLFFSINHWSWDPFNFHPQIFILFFPLMQKFFFGTFESWQLA